MDTTFTVNTTPYTPTGSNTPAFSGENTRRSKKTTRRRAGLKSGAPATNTGNVQVATASSSEARQRQSWWRQGLSILGSKVLRRPDPSHGQNTQATAKADTAAGAPGSSKSGISPAALAVMNRVAAEQARLAPENVAGESALTSDFVKPAPIAGEDTATFVVDRNDPAKSLLEAWAQLGEAPPAPHPYFTGNPHADMSRLIAASLPPGRDSLPQVTDTAQFLGAIPEFIRQLANAKRSGTRLSREETSRLKAMKQKLRELKILRGIWVKSGNGEPLTKGETRFLQTYGSAYASGTENVPKLPSSTIDEINSEITRMYANQPESTKLPLLRKDVIALGTDKTRPLSTENARAVTAV